MSVKIKKNKNNQDKSKPITSEYQCGNMAFAHIMYI